MCPGVRRECQCGSTRGRGDGGRKRRLRGGPSNIPDAVGSRRHPRPARYRNHVPEGPGCPAEPCRGNEVDTCGRKRGVGGSAKRAWAFVSARLGCRAERRGGGEMVSSCGG